MNDSMEKLGIAGAALIAVVLLTLHQADLYTGVAGGATVLTAGMGMVYDQTEHALILGVLGAAVTVAFATGETGIVIIAAAGATLAYTGWRALRHDTAV